jgi:FkbM family methyltransferase
MNAQLNFQKYKEMFGVSPELNKCAIWSSNSELNFNSDNNIGSAVSGMNGRKSNSIKVRGITLSELGIINKISKVDAIKLDCEGAELEAFRDRQFFENNKPRIIFEAILKGERARKYKEALSILKSYGYILSIIDQIGSTQKLIGARHHKDIN